MKEIKIIILMLAGAAVVSCSDRGALFGDRINEGRIEYAVSFPEMDDDNVMMSILPDKMSVLFKGNKYNSEFNTYGGVFKNKISIDTDSRSYVQMLKIFKKRLTCDYDLIDIDELMQESPPFAIIKTDKVDTIAGLPCKIAKGVFYEMGVEDINIYYTDQIGVQNPNWYSPFAELEGFLLGYDVDMFDMRLRLLAENIESEPIEDSEFLAEEDYKKVSYKYIKVELDKLMDSFDL